jgi:hypothetical protein
LSGGKGGTGAEITCLMLCLNHGLTQMGATHRSHTQDQHLPHAHLGAGLVALPVGVHIVHIVDCPRRRHGLPWRKLKPPGRLPCAVGPLVVQGCYHASGLAAVCQADVHAVRADAARRRRWGAGSGLGWAFWSGHTAAAAACSKLLLGQQRRLCHGGRLGCVRLGGRLGLGRRWLGMCRWGVLWG